MIDKNSPVPIYFQLEERIKASIEKKELLPGDLLPSEREYAESLGISRMTVRQAFTNLVNEGYLMRKKGKGTFVAEQKIEQSLSGLTSFTEDMKRRGLEPSNMLIKFHLIPGPESICQRLKIPKHDPVYEIIRIRLADDLPMALERTYLSANLIKGLTETDVVFSLYQYIEQTLNLKIGTATQTLEASIANEQDAKLLKINKGAPILGIQRATYLEDSTPLEVVYSLYRGDRYKFMIDMKR
ncbi:GntR family transcriptional regulator [Bacillus sp. FJAT-47783]|uniref:GntR family transcriptional regulator n=1 Tax=Bacillus sp. FJAT-47783 TaxID=2922712 RepID=UPI001FAE6DC5|nr:GntR family transcriptional regulator [Bacillus sp. FJAT-47783]